MRALLAGVLVVIAGATLVARQGPAPEYSALVDALIERGIQSSLRQDYAGAQACFEEASRKAPFHPAGYLFQAGLLQTQVVDFGRELQSDRFDSLLSSALRIADQWILEPERRALGYYYRGTVEGYRSYAASYAGEWLKAFTEGLSAASDLKNAIELDPKLYDAYAGIGTYYYWKSRKLEFLHWLPVLHDDREEGIRLLRLNVERGSHNRFVALNSLIEVYLDSGRNAEALGLIRSVLHDHPGNRIFRWLKGRALERLGDYQEAADTWGSLYAEYRALTGSTSYPVFVCHIKLARAFLGLNNLATVAEHLEAARQIPVSAFPEHLRTRAEDRLEDLEQLEETLSKELEGAH